MFEVDGFWDFAFFFAGVLPTFLKSLQKKKMFFPTFSGRFRGRPHPVLLHRSAEARGRATFCLCG